MKYIVLSALMLGLVAAHAPVLAKETPRERREREAEAKRKQLPEMQKKCAEAYNQGKDHDAIVGCTAIIDGKFLEGKDLAQIYAVRGAAYLRKKDFAKALADFEAASANDPTEFQNYLGAYIAATQLGDKGKATAALNKGLEIKPDSVDLLRVRCIEKFNAKDFAGAIPDCEKVVAAKADDADVWLAIAQAAEQLKDKAKAKAAYEKVLALNPANTTAKDGLARVSK